MNETFVKQYDAVMVCCGRDSKPHIPEVFKDTSFTGRIVHSKYYRQRETFERQNVLVVGGGISGFDISVDLIPSARKIFFAHHMKSKLEKLPFSIEVINEDVVSLESNRVIFESGRRLDDIDVIVLATGFEFSYDFFHENCGLQVIVGFFSFVSLFTIIFPNSFLFPFSNVTLDLT